MAWIQPIKFGFHSPDYRHIFFQHLTFLTHFEGQYEFYLKSDILRGLEEMSGLPNFIQDRKERMKWMTEYWIWYFRPQDSQTNSL